MSLFSTHRVSRSFLLAGLSLTALGCLTAQAAAVPPVIQSQSVSDLTESNAILEATIIPGRDEEGEWEEAGGAWYQFQLVADPSEYWPEVTCPEEPESSEFSYCRGPYGPPNWEEPVAEITRRVGDLPTIRLMGSLEAKTVTLDLSSVGVVLEPGHTYHYRVIAAEAKQTVDLIKWHSPPIYGPDQTFTTPSPEAPPEEGESSEGPSSLPILPVSLSSVEPTPPPKASKARCSLRPKPKAKPRIGIQCRRAVALRRAR